MPNYPAPGWPCASPNISPWPCGQFPDPPEVDNLPWNSQSFLPIGLCTRTPFDRSCCFPSISHHHCPAKRMQQLLLQLPVALSAHFRDQLRGYPFRQQGVCHRQGWASPSNHHYSVPSTWPRHCQVRRRGCCWPVSQIEPSDLHPHQ